MRFFLTFRGTFECAHCLMSCYWASLHKAWILLCRSCQVPSYTNAWGGYSLGAEFCSSTCCSSWGSCQPICPTCKSQNEFMDLICHLIFLLTHLYLNRVDYVRLITKLFWEKWSQRICNFAENNSRYTDQKGCNWLCSPVVKVCIWVTSSKNSSVGHRLFQQWQPSLWCMWTSFWHLAGNQVFKPRFRR